MLYTTHYMEEAERLCDRIAIIDSGRLQAEGTRDELIRLTGGVDHIRLTGTGDLAAAAERAARAPRGRARRRRPALPDPHGPRRPRGGRPGRDRRPRAAGMTLADVEITRPDLESVFLHLTGKALRD